jgi:hypothetical protein
MAFEVGGAADPAVTLASAGMRYLGQCVLGGVKMNRLLLLPFTALTLTALAGQTAAFDGPQFSITCTGVLATRNGDYFFNQDSAISGLTPDDDDACGGASILPNDKGCWPIRGKSIKQILAVCPIGKTCQIAGVLRNLSHGLYCWTEVNSIAAK